MGSKMDPGKRLEAHAAERNLQMDLQMDICSFPYRPPNGPPNRPQIDPNMVCSSL